MEWTERADAPELPSSLPQVQDRGGGWWERAGWGPAENPEEMIYVNVAGDGGAQGPVLFTVYIVPLVREVPADWRPRAGACDRFPTLPELWEIATEFALDGSLFAPVGPLGMPMIAVSGAKAPPFAPGHGTAFQMMQSGAIAGSPAEKRFTLANAARLEHGILAVPGGVHHG